MAIPDLDKLEVKKQVAEICVMFGLKPDRGVAFDEVYDLIEYAYQLGYIRGRKDDVEDTVNKLKAINLP